LITTFYDQYTISNMFSHFSV